MLVLLCVTTLCFLPAPSRTRLSQCVWFLFSDLRGNQLTGSIPTAIGRMASLVYLCVLPVLRATKKKKKQANI
jgi:hypothetical protein